MDPGPTGAGFIKEIYELTSTCELQVRFSR